MAKQTLNKGSSANDGTGDTLRAGAQKINENFTELYGILGGNSLNSGISFDSSTKGIIFEGSSADDHETFLVPTNATADRTITLPNLTGTVISYYCYRNTYKQDTYKSCSKQSCIDNTTNK